MNGLGNIRLYLILLIGFIACQESYFYSQSQQISPEGWKIDNSLAFEFEIQDTTQKYNLFFDVDHSQDFEYQNLYIKIDTKYPDLTVKSDTLSFNLANTLGDWNGNCSGNSCDLRVFLANRIRFEKLGQYTINFWPFSRDKTVKHLNKITLILQELPLD